VWWRNYDMLSRFHRITERDTQMDGQNCYINIAHQYTEERKNLNKMLHSSVCRILNTANTLLLIWQAHNWISFVSCKHMSTVLKTVCRWEWDYPLWDSSTCQGSSDGGSISVYIPPKSVTVLLTCGTSTHVFEIAMTS